MDRELKKPSSGDPALDSGNQYEQEFSSLISAMHSLQNELDSTPLREAIQSEGYIRHSTINFAGISCDIYFNSESSSAVIFSDSVSVPGRPNSQGITAVVPVDNCLIPAILIPSPSAKTFQAELRKYDETTAPAAIEKYLGYCSYSGQIETFLHEKVHLDQFLDSTPWGLAVTADATIRLLGEYRKIGFEPAICASLQEALKGTPPSRDELIAAQIVQEIKAHAINISTDDGRTTAALKTMLVIEQALAQSDSEAHCLKTLQQAVGAWGNFISQWPEYPAPTSAAIDVAAQWILEAGTV
jgi:hypothetical protein